MKRKAEYSAVEWSQLYPEQRYAIEQAETDASLGRHDPSKFIQVRAADGRGVLMKEIATGRITDPSAVPPRRIA